MRTLCLAAVVAVFFCPCLDRARAADAGENQFFELRTYYTNPGKLDALLKRFRQHTLTLFEKHGMTNVAYWLPVSNEEQILVYLMAYPSREARDASWKAFGADPDWKAAYAESTKNGKLVRKVDSVFLMSTDYSPALKIEAQDPPRLFELRRYTTNEGKLQNLDARFRDHTVNLFAKHGMTNLLYTHLTPGQEGSENTLVYLLAHPDNKARDTAFEAFRLDPEWQKARKESEAAGPLLIKDGVQSLLLKPTDFSPLK
ncbi:MAG: NIPSNAP family protein [Verrucomicrobiae bacterium]|nr:NIPSNAP family protein [Verrucomicrobiae bacterium]